jgi:flagellar hook assembly protein FlgD
MHCLSSRGDPREYLAFPHVMDHSGLIFTLTTVRYSLQSGARVSLAIYDVLGRRVRTLVNGAAGPGRHSVVWNGMGDRGISAASGVYFVRMVVEDKAGVKLFTSKILMLK